ncbi:MAG: helix-turn-helix transcriptional regulator [Staphylococcus sp.]|nr:helix-turn-helix transcriptional regulator [Staphylococcus sp.]
MQINSKDEKKIVERFSHNIRTLRQSAGLSQEKLAELSGLHRTYIGSLERSEKVPSLLTIVKIASALKVKNSQLID